jgi:pimeloyl-ACP methyl ester carboxylesterase
MAERFGLLAGEHDDEVSHDDCAVQPPASCWPPSVRWAPGAETGIAMVAVPGTGLSVDGWRAPLTLLASMAGGVAVALPGYGRRAAGVRDLTPPTSARRLLTRLDELAVPRAVLLGHSSSCQVVAEAARLAPERVAALVLVGPATDPAAATWPRLVGRWARAFSHEAVGQVPLLIRDYSYSGPIGFVRTMEAGRRHRIDRTLAACVVPVLLVRGGWDRIVPASWLDRLLASCPNADTATVEAGSHMLPLTHPHELSEIIRDFLAARGGSGIRGAR